MMYGTRKKHWKGLLSCLLVFVMALAVFPVMASAEETTVDTWDGTADTTWYNDTDTEFRITTAEQLAGLAAIVNDGNTMEGKTILLENDLDLAGSEWTSIGTGNNVARYFGGVFDGQGYDVYNLTSLESSTYYHGLFGVLSQNGTVQNLNVIDANIKATDSSLRVGILADWTNNAKVINCYTSGQVESNGGAKLIGGLVGQCTGGTQFIGCASSASVTSTKEDPESDTVGGLFGQWENATADALITDCWFDGKINCEYDDAAVGGILGANFDFDDDQPGVTIQNCFVATTDITCVQPGNITWIAAIVNSSVTNCYWPVDESLEEQYIAVAKLVVDWSQGTASADPNFDESVCGEAVTDFGTEEFLNQLQENAYDGVQWRIGLQHPTFQWDGYNLSADYSQVDQALVTIPDDLTLYTEESVAALNEAVAMIDRNINQVNQSEVDAMARAIEDAVAALQYKEADYQAVDAAIDKAEALNPEDYQDFSQVEAAIAAVERGLDITHQSEVDAMAQAIEAAIAALEEHPVAEEPSPATGESSDMAFWLFMMVAAGALLVGALAYGKKREQNS